MNAFISHIINLQENGHFKEVINEINIYEKKNSLSPELLNLKGVSLFFLHKYKESIEISQIAIYLLDKDKIDNNKLRIAILNLNGLANHRLANYNKSITSYKKVLKFDPSNLQTLLNLGLAYAQLGNKKKSIECFIKANQLDTNFTQAKDNLIKSLSYCSNINDESNLIIKAENKINKINFQYSKENLISNEMIFSIFKKQNEIIDKYIKGITINSIQTYRKEKLENLNCERHKKIFYDYNIIPEYCFSCFKILIKPESIIDLIKIYIIFDNLDLISKNERKCMIETRDKVEGVYKAFIYCKTIKESNEILEIVKKLIKKNLGKNLNIEIKRGCSEYSKKFKDYKNLKKLFKYNPDWKKKENENDIKYPYLKEDNSNRIVKNGPCIRDVLTIRNWLYFAFLNKDNTYSLVSSEIYKSQYLDRKFMTKLKS